MKFLKNLLNFPIIFFNRLIAITHFLDPKNNTAQRIAAALILLPIAIFAILFSVNLFNFLTILAAIIMTAEWIEMTKSQQNQRKWQIFGLFYILIPLYCAMNLRHQDGKILLWMFVIIWATDIFAFFVGRKFGGPKLLPAVSPNKTWSGLIGGVLASAITALLAKLMFEGSLTFFIIISVFLSLLEQASDLCESKIKRICGVKDSGSIIPGHGGLLDRLDGMIFLAPAVWILVNIYPHFFL